MLSMLEKSARCFFPSDRPLVSQQLKLSTFISKEFNSLYLSIHSISRRCWWNHVIIRVHGAVDLYGNSRKCILTSLCLHDAHPMNAWYVVRWLGKSSEHTLMRQKDDNNNFYLIFFSWPEKLSQSVIHVMNFMFSSFEFIFSLLFYFFRIVIHNKRSYI